ncbi:Pycsar system effector family protein [Actinomadura kijaniata]|uniref:Pycsar system effector family protein n=1 Tax=Actinomadura kijaniata TaxID=46161 RepID=UPI003F1A15A3
MSADSAWKALAEVNGWVRFADAKATAALSLSGLLGGWILALLPAQRHAAPRTVVLAVALVFAALATGLALAALRPAVRRGPPRSLLHFADVARLYPDAAAFADDCADLLDDEVRMVREVGDQIWVNSVIATRKFRHIDRALLALVPGVVLTLGAVLAGAG